MPLPPRRLALPTLLALLLLLPAALARADAAYDRVAQAYAEGGGQLDACFFTQAELEAGLAGIPPAVADVVPEIRRAIRDAIALHEQGSCAGRQPGSAPGPDDPVSSSGAIPPVTTTPEPATDGASAAQPEPAAAPESAPADGTREDERTALVLALIALGALTLLALLAWGWTRMRGWDPAWAARARHGWGEAGFRATTTWSEFADWLRLGR
jgi:hypothetical protein